MDTNPERNDSTQNYGGSASEPLSRETTSLRPGGRLNGRYWIDKELGCGGIGVVYLARDERLLTQEDELPQTLYRVVAKPGDPILITVQLRIGK